MTTARVLLTTALALMLGACVTINVYFPAAEAEKAAQEFIENVIGDDAGNGTGAVTRPSSWRLPIVAGPERILIAALLVSTAQAQADIDIRTPQILAIQERMAQRFQTQLRTYFDSGVVGLTSDGMVEVRDASAVALRDRNTLTQLVGEDNRDRGAVYREIAVANGHPEWEAQIRSTFAQQWIESARAGWYYKTASGEWRQK